MVAILEIPQWPSLVKIASISWFSAFSLKEERSSRLLYIFLGSKFSIEFFGPFIQIWPNFGCLLFMILWKGPPRTYFFTNLKPVQSLMNSGERKAMSFLRFPFKDPHRFSLASSLILVIAPA